MTCFLPQFRPGLAPLASGEERGYHIALSHSLFSSERWATLDVLGVKKKARGKVISGYVEARWSTVRVGDKHRTQSRNEFGEDTTERRGEGAPMLRVAQARRAEGEGREARSAL